MKVFEVIEQIYSTTIQIQGYGDTARIAKILAMNGIKVRVNEQAHEGKYSLEIESWTSVSKEIDPKKGDDQ